MIILGSGILSLTQVSERPKVVHSSICKGQMDYAVSFGGAKVSIKPSAQLEEPFIEIAALTHQRYTSKGD